jgi:choline dehydrogenase-like flavoprotein
VPLDARTLPDGERIDTDICIVGAGPAGLALARTLAGSGPRICLIDSGDTQSDDAARDLADGRNAGLDYFTLRESRGRAFGGSSLLWNVPRGDADAGLRLRPLDPVDFEQRDWLPYSGWPFDRTHLDPYYSRAADMAGIEMPPPTAEDWAARSGEKPLCVDPLTVRSVLFQIGSASRWHGEAAAGELVRRGVTVLLNGTVVEVECTRERRRVTGVRVATLTGKHIRVGAGLVVLACGGIDNARLMLLSRLGNDLVGRYFMEHPHFTAGVIVPRDATLFQETRLYRPHTAEGKAVEARLTLTDHVVREEQLVGCSVALHARPRSGDLSDLESRPVPSDGEAAAALLASALRRKAWPAAARRLLAHVGRDVSGAVRAGQRIAGHRRGSRQQRQAPAPGARPKLFTLYVNAEQAPDPASRVRLDRTRDALGQRRARLEWRVREDDIARITRTVAIIARHLESAGLGRVHTPLHPALPPPGMRGGYHHMGTTRMHRDPAQGVVDGDGRVHGVDNLYVTGSSVFPTGGHFNPTLTVAALAIRLGDHLAQRFRVNGPRVAGHGRTGRGEAAGRSGR